MEQDPFILTGLMWAWLEQLKEPVISIQAAKALNPDNTDAQTILNTLDQVSSYILLYFKQYPTVKTSNFSYKNS